MATIKQHFKTTVFEFRSATAFPQYTKVDGTNAPVTGLAYDATIEQSAYVEMQAINYGSGNWTAALEWYGRAISGGVTWGISMAAITPNTDTQDVETKSFATETLVSDTHLGTTTQRAHSVAMAISNLDSVSADDWVWLKVSRKPGDSSDTLAGFAILTKLTIFYSDT